MGVSRAGPPARHWPDTGGLKLLNELRQSQSKRPGPGSRRISTDHPTTVRQPFSKSPRRLHLSVSDLVCATTMGCGASAATPAAEAKEAPPAKKEEAKSTVAEAAEAGATTSGSAGEKSVLVAAEATTEYGPVDQRVAAIFDLMDKNSDGSLSKAECLIALRKQENVREALGISSVTEGDGKEKFDAMFAKMDVDGNANISLVELNAFLQEVLPAATYRTSD